jgi:heme exporter protein D
MNGYLIAAYAILWVGLLAYIGWVALRMRGVKSDVETLRDLLDERARAARARSAKRAQAAKLATQAAPQPTAQPGKAAPSSQNAPGSFKPTKTGNSKPAARKK